MTHNDHPSSTAVDCFFHALKAPTSRFAFVRFHVITCDLLGGAPENQPLASSESSSSMRPATVSACLELCSLSRSSLHAIMHLLSLLAELQLLTRRTLRPKTTQPFPICPHTIFTNSPRLDHQQFQNFRPEKCREF